MLAGSHLPTSLRLPRPEQCRGGGLEDSETLSQSAPIPDDKVATPMTDAESDVLAHHSPNRMTPTRLGDAMRGSNDPPSSWRTFPRKTKWPTDHAAMLTNDARNWRTYLKSPIPFTCSKVAPDQVTLGIDSAAVFGSLSRCT